MSDLIDTIRNKIEMKHQKALQALNDLQEYLNDPDLLNANGKAPIAQSSGRIRTGRRGSIRARVLKLIKDEWATVEEIASKTGLGEGQVRGVINAPGLDIQRRNEGGHTKYRFGETEQE